MAPPAWLAWFQSGKSPSSTDQNVQQEGFDDAEALQDWPQAIAPDPTPALGGRNDFWYRLCQESQDRVDVKIGTGRAAKRYKIHGRLICHYSSYFKGACHSGFAESLSKQFDLADDDPVAFKLFVHWMYSWDKEPPIYNTATSLSEWTLEIAESAWMLADKLIAPEFGKYALAQFVQRVHLMTAERLATVYTQTSRDAPLRLFCSRWIAFCRGSKNNDVSKVLQRNEYEELNISIQGSSDDPRRYEIGHWYEPCGKSMAPECLHGTTTPQTNWPQMRQPWSSWPGLSSTVLLYAALALFTILILGLSIALLVAEGDGSIRQTTKNFDIFVALVLIITLVVPLAFPLTGIFAVGAATATAVDANTCFSDISFDYDPLPQPALPPVSTCQITAALASFLWLSLPMFFVVSFLQWREIYKNRGSLTERRNWLGAGGV